VFVPRVSAADGNRVRVKIIHERDGDFRAGQAVLTTYKEVSDRAGIDHWQRFFGGGELRESLPNCTWQNENYGAAVGVAHAAPGALTQPGLQARTRRRLDVLPAVPAWGERQLTVPGNYGRIWSNT
jgi:hypothetical protein